MLSCRIWRFRKFAKLSGMLPEIRFWSQEKIWRFSRLPREEGSDPCTSPAEIISWVRYTKLPNAGVSVPESPGLPADCGPRKRDPTLLTPSTVTHWTPLKDSHGSTLAANSQVLKKLPPGKSTMLFFTDARTSKSCWSRSCWASRGTMPMTRHKSVCSKKISTMSHLLVACFPIPNEWFKPVTEEPTPKLARCCFLTPILLLDSSSYSSCAPAFKLMTWIAEAGFFSLSFPTKQLFKKSSKLLEILMNNCKLHKSQEGVWFTQRVR